MVGQFLTGHMATDVPFAGAGGDPAFAILPPYEQFLDYYVFLAPEKYIDDYVVITHPAGDARAHLDQHLALAHDGVVELADLVALRQVGVEIVLAVEGRVQVDLGLEAQPGAHRLRHAGLVDDGQHARHSQADRTYR